MKRWTVMLIPHDRGETRTLDISAKPFLAALTFAAVLVFAAAFSFQYSRAVTREHKQVLEATAQLLAERDAEPAPQAVRVTGPADSGLSDEQRREIEDRLRREYDASIEALAAELMSFHELETKVREIGGLPPRAEDTRDLVEDPGDGRGGPTGGIGPLGILEADSRMRPLSLIYGLSRPSADLLLQEIHLREASLEAYVRDGQLQVDALSRKPSLRPVRAGRLTSRFGTRIDPINRRLSQHNGIDIAASTGTPVYATAQGRVISSERESQFGNIIRIDHGNGIETWYAHLSARQVSVGSVVKKGQQIGKVGATGRVTGPHLHYEVHVNGKPVDGRKYLSD